MKFYTEEEYEILHENDNPRSNAMMFYSKYNFKPEPGNPDKGTITVDGKTYKVELDKAHENDISVTLNNNHRYKNDAVIHLPRSFNKNKNEIIRVSLNHEIGHINTSYDAPEKSYADQIVAKDNTLTDLNGVNSHYLSSSNDGKLNKSKSNNVRSRNIERLENYPEYGVTNHATADEAEADIYAKEHTHPKSNATDQAMDNMHKFYNKNALFNDDSLKLLKQRGKQIGESLWSRSPDTNKDSSDAIGKHVARQAARTLQNQFRLKNDAEISFRKRALSDPKIDRTVYAKMNPYDQKAINAPRDYGNGNLTPKQVDLNAKINANTKADQEKNPQHKQRKQGTQTMRTMNNSVELVDTAMSLVESGNIDAAQILIEQILNEDGERNYLIRELMQKKGFTKQQAIQFANQNLARGHGAQEKNK